MAQPSIQHADSEAVASLVLGILSLAGFSILTGIPAVILGRSARRKITANPQYLTGVSMAKIGIVTGWISIWIIIVIVIAIVAILTHR